jgi:hypothetical protein
VVEVAGHRGHHVAGTIVELEEVPDPLRGHGRHRLLATEDLAAKRVVGEERRRALLCSLVGGLVGVHEDLVEDDQPLGVEVRGPQRRRPHDVGEDVQSQGEVLGQQPDVKGRVLLGGEGVEVAAHLVDRLGDGRRRPLRGPLEQEVLEEVGGAGVSESLVTRARAHPEADAHRPGVVHPFGDQ